VLTESAGTLLIILLLSGSPFRAVCAPVQRGQARTERDRTQGEGFPPDSAHRSTSTSLTGQIGESQMKLYRMNELFGLYQAKVFSFL
jgi:hypothetical protein